MAYTTTDFMPLKLPTPGSREPAQISLINENMVVVSEHDHADGKGVPVATVRSGLAANRPLPSAAGGIYFATDTGIVSLDNGSTWTDFLTSGGQATVTGWTLIDPIIRDTLQFGPEGSATIDNNITRTGANALRTDSNLGVGVTPDPQWSANLKIVQFGSAGTLVGYGGADAEEVQFTANSVGRVDGKQYAILPNSPANRLRLSQGALIFEGAPAVAAGLEQTFTTRLSLAANNTLVVGVPAGDQPNVRISPAQASAPPGAVLCIEMQHTASAGIDWHQMGVAKWGMLYGIAGTVRVGNDLGWGYPGVQVMGSTVAVHASGSSTATAALNVNPVTLYTDLAIQSNGKINITGGAGANNILQITKPGVVLLIMGEYGSNSSVISAPSGNIYLNAGGTVVCPLADNGTHLGHTANRWYAVYAANGTIQTSHVSQKENFAPLDPAACVEAVLDTQWWSFDYKAPSPPPVAPAPEGETDEQREQREQQEAAIHANYLKMVEETAPSRKQKGFVLGSEAHQTADLFGQADRRSASPSSDLAVVACALQSALQRIAALEATNASA